MTLKQSFAGAVASVALISAAHTADLQPVLKAPAAVEQQATGYVEVYSGWASIRETSCINASCSSERFNGWALGGAGRANYWITREVSVQRRASGKVFSSSVCTESMAEAAFPSAMPCTWALIRSSLRARFVTAPCRR